jgi:hypothetical protein
MTTNMNETSPSRKTWRRKGGIASWTFSAPPADPAPVQTSFHAAMRAIGDYAVVSRVSFDTRMTGEDTIVLDGQPDLAQVDEVFAAHDDISAVHLNLDLSCLDEGGDALTIRQGAALWIEVDDQPGARTVSVFFSLDVDIYAPRSWGVERDNARLAALNGPRLTGFLRRLRNELHADEIEVDAPDYEGVTVDGFPMPSAR